jgi:hypothetical protein
VNDRNLKCDPQRPTTNGQTIHAAILRPPNRTVSSGLPICGGSKNRCDLRVWLIALKDRLEVMVILTQLSVDSDADFNVLKIIIKSNGREISLVIDDTGLL